MCSHTLAPVASTLSPWTPRTCVVVLAIVHMPGAPILLVSPVCRSVAMGEPPTWRASATVAAAQAFVSSMSMLIVTLEADSLWPRTWSLGVPLSAAGLASRLRAFGGALTEFTLAAESSAIPLTRGLLALDRAPGRDAAAPALGCRAVRVALAMGASLLLRSSYGPPKLPDGSGWRSPTRSSSVTLPSPRALGGRPARLGSPTRVASCVWWRRLPLGSRRRTTSASIDAALRLGTAFGWTPGGLCVESGSSAVLPLECVALLRLRFRLPRPRLLPAFAPLCSGSSLPCGGALLREHTAPQ